MTMVFFPIVLVIAQSGGWASARPAECASLDGGRGANMWERAKAPDLRRYCDLLASGAAKLATASQQAAAPDAFALAEQADALLPNRAAPLVLKGRALARAARWTEAYDALQGARARDERALDDPQSLLAWARVLARTGRVTDAQEAYRALLPRGSALASQERGAASLEAGLLAMARGPSGLDEAVAILRQARRDAQDATQTFAVLALALALDRAGEAEEARAVLAERVHADPRPVLADPRVKEVLATAAATNEGHAAAALALEGIDGKAAKEEWKAFVAGAPAGVPWLDHAKRHDGAPQGKPKARGVR
jgi:tetratricopeptide (TPR) repeat protein